MSEFCLKLGLRASGVASVEQMEQLPPGRKGQEPHVIRADRRFLWVQELNWLPLFDYSRVRSIDV